MILLLAAPAFALPLLVERFEATTLPAGWKTEIGAQVGGGKQNEATVESGTLVLRADKGTKRFTAVSRTLDMRGVSWIRVSLRQRSENVDPTAARYQNANAFVQFEGGPVQGLRLMTGTNDWTNITRTFAVPADVRDVKVGLFLSMPGMAAFDDLLVEPVELEANKLRRGPFTYHWFGRDGFTEEHLETNDNDHARIAAFLEVPLDTPVEFWRYANLDAIEEFTGRRGNGHADGNAVHTIWRTEAHELTHVLARPWGNPVPLLGEGLAVHMSGAWQGKDIRLAARGAGAASPAVTLASLVDPVAFRAVPEDTGYAIAGAFAGWVIETKGKDALKAMYGKAGDPKTAQAAIEAALGMSLADADKAIRAWW